MSQSPSFTFGIEEEYLLVDPESRDLVTEAPTGIFDSLREASGEQTAPEFLQCQVEIGTRVCNTAAEARAELIRLRRCVADVAEAHDCRLMAASTHPFARWQAQQRTRADRYQALEDDLQEVARRLMICGMHVHVGIDDDELRIDLMNQVAYILPHLLCLSTSSPLWGGQPTGLRSYRISIWDEMPRTGLPEAFESYAEFKRHVDVMVEAGIIDEGSKIWWDVRPSVRYPTLEMRVSDLCTEVDDALCIASLYRCWLRMLWRLRRRNQRWRRYSSMLVHENRWRAQRYGLDRGLVDFGRRQIVPFAELLEEIIELISEDAAYFGCEHEIAHAREIVRRGTSSHWQMKKWDECIAAGMSPQEAGREVVDMLVERSRPPAHG